MINKHICAFFFFCAFLIVSTNAWSQYYDTIDPALQDNYTIAIADVKLDLNPHTATYSTEAQVLNALFEGLYAYDPKTLDPIPAIAEDCTISRDKKRWTFTIRQTAKFSDGSPITSHTIRDSWIKLLQTKDAPYASLLDCIQNAQAFRTGKADESTVGIKAKNDYTLIITLQNPTSHFARLLCHHSFSVVSDKADSYSGAFALTENSDKTLTLTKNEHYWDKENVPLKQITIIQSNDTQNNTWLFNEGSIDWIYSMVDVRSLVNESTKHIGSVFGTEYLFFTCKNKPWDDVDFRNALLTAVPWAELRKSLIMPAKTFVYPLAGYPDVEGLTYTDTDYAIELMNQARIKNNIPLDQRLTIIFGISDSERMRTQAELLKNAWENLGVDVVIQKTTDDRYLSSISGWDADIFSYSWIGDFADPMAFLELFRHNSTLNQSQWFNPKYENLLQKSLLTNDSTERFKMQAEAELTLLDDGVVMPISHSISLHAINLKQTGGWYANALDIHPFKFLYKKQYDTQVPSWASTVVKK